MATDQENRIIPKASSPKILFKYNHCSEKVMGKPRTKKPTTRPDKNPNIWAPRSVFLPPVPKKASRPNPAIKGNTCLNKPWSDSRNILAPAIRPTAPNIDVEEPIEECS